MSRNSDHDKFVQPHNYRLYFDFKRIGYKGTFMEKGWVLGGSGGSDLLFNLGEWKHKKINHNKEDLFLNYNNCTIRVYKETICIQSHLYKDQWVTRRQEVESSHFDKLAAEFEKHARETLEYFLGQFGGESQRVITNKYSHNKIHGDEVLRKVPKEVFGTTEKFHKLYDEEIEFRDLNDLENYIENRSLEQVAPIIEVQLNSLIKTQVVHGQMLNDLMKAQTIQGEMNISTAKMFQTFTIEFLPTHREHAENIKTHTAVMKEIKSGLESHNKLLYASVDDKKAVHLNSPTHQAEDYGRSSACSFCGSNDFSLKRGTLTCLICKKRGN